MNLNLLKNKRKSLSILRASDGAKHKCLIHGPSCIRLTVEQRKEYYKKIKQYILNNIQTLKTIPEIDDEIFNSLQDISSLFQRYACFKKEKISFGYDILALHELKERKVLGFNINYQLWCGYPTEKIFIKNPF